MFIHNERDLAVNRLLRGARPILEAHGITAEVIEPNPSDRHFDLIARLDAGRRGHQTYAVELKSRLDRAGAAALPPTELPMLVIAPYISPPTAAVLQQNKVDFVDHAGNMTISWPQLLIIITGNRRPDKEQAPPTRAPRAFSPAGSKVVFALLSWPDTVTLPLRDIAARSGVSLGTTQIVINELEVSRYIYTVENQRTLANGRELLDRWTEAFTTSVAHKLTLAEFRDVPDRWWQETRKLLVENRIQIGGEAGGSLLDSDLIPTSTTLYCDAIPGPLIAARHWRRTHTASNISVRKRFWSPPEPFDPLVPSTLIYADMWTSTDPRQRAHAERIRRHDDRLVQLDGS
ncbi:type IV toxin-antitoxin system AbiEi family antitoxin [Nocardia sp. NPDC052566]|uniref:type IV toxin-antitoxin system AbiEi family antitoxin n=1 Tax=Nocardia sp. NPDC052566 TaxID=3364330 RepID=UPI0037C62715